ncbi:MAG: 50S ribosomal protein L25 [Actinomycetota bacterium]|nr:50S ribosomal protein L25 [Actinomycetota bacterium]
MPEIRLPVEAGRPTGSSASGRLRTAGKVPGVIYGHGIEPVPVAVEGKALRSALTTEAGLNALLDLQVDGTSHLTVARDVQRDPVRGTVLHVDFQVVRRDEVISADVPVNLVGEAEELQRADGVVDHQLFMLTVNATPGRIPNVIEVDVSGLAVGDTIRVGDVRLPEGVRTDVDPEVPIVVGQPPQVSEEDLLTEAEAAEAAAVVAEEAAPDAQAGAETVADLAAREDEAGAEG